MVGKTEKTPQLDIFRTPLKQFINHNHELFILSNKIDWEGLTKEFQGYYKDFGRPSVPIRKMVGLVLLKYIYNLSDENVVDRWIENPYWQYFTGEVFFQLEKPFDPSDFVHFRKRIGEKGAELLLKLSIDLFGKEAKEKEVLIDTTVQEKNITFPTDTKLHKKIIDKCNTIAQSELIPLRQSYKRVIKQLMIDQRFRNHPKRKKKAKSAARKIKTIAGRLVRDLDRKMDEAQKAYYGRKIEIFNQILQQEKDTKNKVYSIHEPEVKCIAKGKEAKPYEFGNKSSFVKTKKSGIIVGAMAFTQNLYDGDTLEPQLEQVERVASYSPDVAIVDRGYRGKKHVNGTQIITPKPLPQSASRYQKQKTRERFRSRAGIEPVISHIKHDHRMIRNYLSGLMGDKVNTIMAATAFNLKKMLNKIKKELKNIFCNFIEKLFHDIFCCISILKFQLLKKVTF
jgi:IS5 family transposase